jgi:hypothetical protein
VEIFPVRALDQRGVRSHWGLLSCSEETAVGCKDSWPDSLKILEPPTNRWGARAPTAYCGVLHAVAGPLAL